MLPDSVFETNRSVRKGYRDADVLAVRIVMLFFRKNNIRQTLSFLETSMGVRMIVGMENVRYQHFIHILIALKLHL